MDDDALDAADAQGLPQEVLEVPDEDDLTVGPKDDDFDDEDIARLTRWGLAA